MMEEESFPRGGPKPRTDTKLPKKRKSSKNERSLKRKRTNTEDNHLPTSNVVAVSANIITYKQLQDEMLLLGCIRHITSFALQVELPGKIHGNVSISNISDPYRLILEQNLGLENLKQLFHVGQFLPTRVIEKVVEGNKTNIVLSINPRDVNSEWNYSVFRKNLLVWAAVKSKLDHGYLLDAGVENSTLFLPFANVDKDTTLEIGQPLWCIVTKCVLDSTSNATVSILQKDLFETKQDNNISQHCFIPGMQFDFKVSEVVDFGLQGLIQETHIGYVNDNYLTGPFDIPTRYKPDQILKSVLLYIQPTTRLSYYSLRSLWETTVPIYKKGEILRGEVFSRTSGGINLKLPNNTKGFMSLNRLMVLIALKDQAKLEKALKTQFAIGSSRRFRILDYNYIEQVYICSCEKHILNEKYFAINDLKIAELVTVTVENVLSNGLQVSLGNIMCFIENMHLSDVKYTENIKRSFAKGQKLNARVWSNDAKNVHLTCKKSLVKSDLCLTEINNDIIGQKYPAVVATISKKGILVIFYNKVRGFLPRQYLMKAGKNYENMFYTGQVITLLVEDVRDNALVLKLPMVDSYTKVGQYVSATVMGMRPSGLDVEIDSNGLQGFIPTAHLSSSLSLTSLLLDTYKIGDHIKNLLCIKRKDSIILSLREAMAYKAQKMIVKKLKDLKEGSLLRCSYKENCESGIYVTTPMIPDEVTLKISKGDIINKKQQFENLKFNPEQAVVVKVTKVENKEIQATAKLSEVFDNSLENSLGLLKQFLLDNDRIKAYLMEVDAPLGKLELGQLVECCVTKVTTMGCALSLENGVRGLLNASNSNNLKVGQKLKGVIVWINYKQEFVEISTCATTKEQSLLGPNVNKDVVCGNVLAINSDCVVGGIKKGGLIETFVFIPNRIHENSFGGLIDYNLNTKVKIILSGEVNGKLVGFDKKLNHLIKKVVKEKRKADHSLKDEIKVGPMKIRNDNSNTVEIEDKKRKKRKRSESNLRGIETDNIDSSTVEPESQPMEVENDNDSSYGSIQNIDDEDIHSNFSDSEVSDEETSVQPVLPGVGDFFTLHKKKLDSQENESDKDETLREEVAPKRRKKLNAVERKEQAMREEEELIRREIENADLTAEPKTEEQFLKLLAGQPNNSKLWISYMSFLIANSEMEKARQVATDALSKIDLELTNERYNIWITLLNFENMYGDKDSFDEVFRRATEHNDSLQIYLFSIQMFADSNKLSEMESLISKARKKFKHEIKMWLDIGRIYYKNGQLQKARSLKDSAVVVLPSKVRIKLLVQNAIMELQYGEESMGEALFETLIQNCPNRVDIWCTYIDQVVKKGNIDTARRILGRAVSQNIPVKKLKTLFAKYKNFELKHGNSKQVDYVVKLAKDYVNK